MSKSSDKKLEAESGTYELTGQPARLRHLRLLEDGDVLPSFIGEVACRWAYVEHALDVIIWDLSGTGEVIGSCFTAQVMGAAARFRIILAIAKSRNFESKIIKQINRLITDSYDLIESRNRILHDPWFFEDIIQYAQLRSSSSKETRFGFTDVTVKELVKIIKSMREFHEKVSLLHQEIMAQLPSSTSRPSQEGASAPQS